MSKFQQYEKNSKIKLIVRVAFSNRTDEFEKYSLQIDNAKHMTLHVECDKLIYYIMATTIRTIKNIICHFFSMCF